MSLMNPTHQFAPLLILVMCVISLRARDLQGDQHVDAINQEFNTLSTAYTLFVKMVEERRPVEQVAHALDVLADEYDWFYARLSQFLLWLKVAPDAAEGFSESGRAQMQTLLKRTLPTQSELDTLMIPYRSDQRIVNALNRITASYNRFLELTSGSR